jgi:hypothetical protein
MINAFRDVKQTLQARSSTATVVVHLSLATTVGSNP